MSKHIRVFVVLELPDVLCKVGKVIVSDLPLVDGILVSDRASK